MYVDEIHTLINAGEKRVAQIKLFREGVELMESKFQVKFFLHGATARITLPPKSQLEKFFGRSVETVSMTSEESSSFRDDIFGLHPHPPTAFEQIVMPTPFKNPQYFTKSFERLQLSILKYCVLPPNTTKHVKGASKSEVSAEIDRIVGRLPCTDVGKCLPET